MCWAWQLQLNQVATQQHINRRSLDNQEQGNVTYPKHSEKRAGWREVELQQCRFSIYGNSE